MDIACSHNGLLTASKHSQVSGLKDAIDRDSSAKQRALRVLNVVDPEEAYVKEDTNAQ